MQCLQRYRQLEGRNTCLALRDVGILLHGLFHLEYGVRCCILRYAERNSEIKFAVRTRDRRCRFAKSVDRPLAQLRVRCGPAGGRGSCAAGARGRWCGSGGRDVLDLHRGLRPARARAAAALWPRLPRPLRGCVAFAQGVVPDALPRQLVAARAGAAGRSSAPGPRCCRACRCAAGRCWRRHHRCCRGAGGARGGVAVRSGEGANLSAVLGL
mmetsp:Transcript_170912/g.547772  ORF Transcript_170912/g.547772 Transcript_170912/m.547772 type:complete len:212 (-) Transcript_170912:8-643(-)